MSRFQSLPLAGAAILMICAMPLAAQEAEAPQAGEAGPLPLILPVPGDNAAEQAEPTAEGAGPLQSRPMPAASPGSKCRHRNLTS